LVAARCNPGQPVIGGGYKAFEALQVLESRPGSSVNHDDTQEGSTGANDSWVVVAQNNTVNTITLDVYAICATPPQPTNTPTPPPCLPVAPTPGQLLYQADWSGGFDGWMASPDWKTVSGQLVNDGTNGDATQFAHAPTCTANPANYAVEAEIQYVRDGYGCYPPADYGYIAFGLSVRGESSGDYRMGIVHRYGTMAAFIFDHGSSDTCPNFYPPLAKASYSLDTNWHTYRVEVRGNDIKLLIDGQSVIEAIDNHHLTSNSVGLWSTGTVLNVRSFKVIAL
jgi:hypothetical protein